MRACTQPIKATTNVNQSNAKDRILLLNYLIELIKISQQGQLRLRIFRHTHQSFFVPERRIFVGVEVYNARAISAAHIQTTLRHFNLVVSSGCGTHKVSRSDTKVDFLYKRPVSSPCSSADVDACCSEFDAGGKLHGPLQKRAAASTSIFTSIFINIDTLHE